MRGVLPVAVLLAACEPPGLTLEVTTTNANVRSVELLVGVDCPDNCPGRIAPPALAPRSVDRIFVVEDDAPWTAPVEGGVAGFRITVDSATEVDLLLAIGVNADRQPVETAYAYDVTIPTSRGEYVRVPLETAAPVAASLTVPPEPYGTEGLAIWREPAARRACVLAEHWTGDAEPRRDLVVPADDPDCDEVATANECAPWTPLAMGAPSTIDAADCAIFGALPSGADVCMFGGTPCNELSPTTTPQCAPLDTNYCTPNVLCSACAGPWDPMCAFDALSYASNTGALPSLECTFRVSDAGVPCTDEAIIPNVDAQVLLGAPAVTSCTSVGLHDLKAPFGPFDDHVQTPLGLFKVDGLAAPCAMVVHWKGTALPPGGAATTAIVFVDLDLDNSNHLALPAVIYVETGCATAPTCAFVQSNYSDPMLECARQEPTPPALCGRTLGGHCLNGGPDCGSGCCAAGEQCIGDICSCGSGPACGSGDQCIAAVQRQDQCGTTCCGLTPCPF